MKEPNPHRFIQCRVCKVRSECLTCNRELALTKFYDSVCCTPCHYKKMLPSIFVYPQRFDWYKLKLKGGASWQFDDED